MDRPTLTCTASTLHLHCICTLYCICIVQALQDDPTSSDLEELSLKLNAVEVAHYKSLEAATPEPQSSTDTGLQEDGVHGVSD